MPRRSTEQTDVPPFQFSHEERERVVKTLESYMRPFPPIRPCNAACADYRGLEHRGAVRRVRVESPRKKTSKGPYWYWYCECAIDLDESRGFVVTVLEEDRWGNNTDDAVRETEKALETFLRAQADGWNEKPKPVDPSARQQVVELQRIGQRLSRLLRSLSGEARWYLEATDPLTRGDPRDRTLRLGPPEDPLLLVDDRRRGQLASFDTLESAAARLKSWGNLALAKMDAEGTPETSPGRGYRWAHRRAGEALADVWKKYTGRGLWYGRESDGGPFPRYLQAAIGAVDPRFQGTRMAREIHRMRQERKRVDRLQAEKPQDGAKKS
jgi:hypothetical protein